MIDLLEGDTLFSVVLTLPYEICFVLLLLAVLGLLWAFPAAVVSGIVAGIRKLKVRSYVFAGAEHSMSLTLPWFYLMAEITLGRPPLSRHLVVATYTFLFGLWIVGPIGLNIGIVSAYLLDLLVFNKLPPLFMAIGSAFWTMILLANAIACISSIKDMRLRDRMDRGIADPLWHLSPVQGYLTPFKWLAFWSIILPFDLITSFVVGGGNAY